MAAVHGEFYSRIDAR